MEKCNVKSKNKIKLSVGQNYKTSDFYSLLNENRPKWHSKYAFTKNS